jgi:hypothetical protein
MIDIKPTGKDFNGQVELELTAGPFKGTKFYYEGMKMADEENPDGSMNMSFDYVITGGDTPKKLNEFEQVLGETILQILEEQIAKNEVVYTGGVDEPKE